MRRSFEGLPAPDKWLLIALLEAGYWPLMSEVQHLYDLHCPAELKRPIGDLVEELVESFISVTPRKISYLEGQTIKETNALALAWTHPSYRDLVIDELSASESLRNAFLNTMTVPGIKLALSDTGGSAGNRRLPLLVDNTSWTILFRGILEVAAQAPVEDVIAVINALRSTHSSAEKDLSISLVQAMEQLLSLAVRRWDAEKAVLTADQLGDYVEATLICSPLPPVPDLTYTWSAGTAAISSALQDQWSFLGYEGRDIFADWVKLLRTIRDYEPRFLRLVQFGYRAEDQDIIAKTSAIFSIHARAVTGASTKEEFEYEIRSLNRSIEALDCLQSLLPKDIDWDDLSQATAEMRQKHRQMEKEAEGASSEEDNNAEPVRSNRQSFDVKALFSDL